MFTSLRALGKVSVCRPASETQSSYDVKILRLQALSHRDLWHLWIGNAHGSNSRLRLIMALFTSYMHLLIYSRIALPMSKLPQRIIAQTSVIATALHDEVIYTKPSAPHSVQSVICPHLH